MDSIGRIIVALDTTKERALGIVEVLSKSDFRPAVLCLKVNRLIHQEAARPQQPYLLKTLKSFEIPVWADLKLHDIPRTVASSIEPYLDTGVSYVTVMARGGIPMMEEAIKVGIAQLDITVIAVTELTSLSEEEIHLGSGQLAKASVLNLVKDAHLAGVRFIVCSGQELKFLRSLQKAGAFKFLNDLNFFIPGITPAWKQEGQADQERTSTPEEALKAGVRALVIGSAIVNADDPVEALAKTVEEIEAIDA